MKLLNQAFALVMPLLPEGEGKAADQDSEPVTPETPQPKRDSLFSVFRKRVSGLKKAGPKRRRGAHSRPKAAGRPAGSAAERKRPGPVGGRQRQRRPSGAPSFESFLIGSGAASAAQSPMPPKPGSSANEAYSRYVRFKNQMQVQRRRPRQAVVSRVEKISPVHRVRRVGDE